jgi:hypothetical protein
MNRYCKWAGILCLISASCSEDTSKSPTEPITQPDPPIVNTLTFSQDQYSFTSLGATETVKISATDQYGSYFPNPAISWTTSNAPSVEVNSRGMLTAISEGSATITATAGSTKKTAVVTVVQETNTIEFTKELIRFQNLQDTITIEVNIKDSRGNIIDTPDVTWSSADESIVRVDNQGLATSLTDGRTAVTVSSGAISAALSIIVSTGGGIVISSITPNVLIEGSRGTLEGEGLWDFGNNELTLGGSVVQITSATSTQVHFMLPLFDCLPPRRTQLTLKNSTDSVGIEVSVMPQNIQSLALGQNIISAEACIHLQPGSSNQKFLIGALSQSESAADLNEITLKIKPGVQLRTDFLVDQSFNPDNPSRYIPLPNFPVTPVMPPTIEGQSISIMNVTFENHIQEEHAIRANEKLLIEEIGIDKIRRELRPQFWNIAPQDILNQEVSLGDTVPFNMGLSCASGDTLQVLAQIAYIGDETVWYEDIGNPLPESFTASEYQNFDTQYTSKTLPVLKEYYGDYGDIDSNGKLSVLVTKEVNKRKRTLGFVWGGDLVPSNLCPGANQAEIFYGLAPDPEGTIENRVVPKSWLTDLYDPLIAHETTHVIQITGNFYQNSEYKSSWEMEGGATLAEQLVGYEIYGNGSGLDLGLSDFNTGFKWYRDWASDLTYYFGYSKSGKVPNAPEECSWMGKESQGNAGPCENLRAVYGVPSIFMRMVLDLYGPNYPGGEKALSRALVGSTDHSGLSNYSQITGIPKQELLATFAMTLWGDGQISNNLTSWNLRDVMGRWTSDRRLQPYISDIDDLTLPLNIRGGSSSYLEWSSAGLNLPSSIQIRNSGSGTMANMVLWIQRIE